jgi:hypothetical protein
MLFGKQTAFQKRNSKGKVGNLFLRLWAVGLAWVRVLRVDIKQGFRQKKISGDYNFLFFLKWNET